MGRGRLARLARIAERVTYWTIAAPVLAFLPAAVGYRVACWRGDWLFRSETAKRAALASNVRLVLGDDLSADTERATVRDWFRLASCEAVDVMRLRRKGQPLRRLVEIRGREHLEAALAEGKGALLCSAHFGSFDSGFSMLGASGFKVTTIGRWQHKYTVGLSGAERRFWDRVYTAPLQRLRHRPNIEPWAGRIEVAAKAAVALRANEVVTISIDVPPLDGDRGRAVEVPFLGGSARLLPGVVTLAKLTGAPVLMCFLHRSPDYRHQVLRISAPVPIDGGTAMAFQRCAAEVSAAIAKSPSHWQYLASTADLADLGLISGAMDTQAATPPMMGTTNGLQPLSSPGRPWRPA
jgi:KDO2-lipid IV(A) lauroyltransferase